MRGRGPVFLFSLITTILLMLAFVAGAPAKTIGGCPEGFELVVANPGPNPNPSIDGNGDGLTCLKPVPAAEGSFAFGGFVVRDNTILPG